MTDATSSSRSDATTVAVGFSPRSAGEILLRRGATPELWPAFQPSLRDGLSVPVSIRGLKSTATFTKSLRDSNAATSHDNKVTGDHQ
jgi:hypothetical protein